MHKHVNSAHLFNLLTLSVSLKAGQTQQDQLGLNFSPVSFPGTGQPAKCRNFLLSHLGGQFKSFLKLFATV